MEAVGRERRAAAPRGPLLRDTKRRLSTSYSDVSTARGEPEGIAFRQLVRALIRARSLDRGRHFRLVIDRLKKAKDPAHCINIVLDEFATQSGPDGLGLGVDVLSHAGSAVLAAAERFAVTDGQIRNRDRGTGINPKRFIVHDDVWYMLLRAVARVEAPALGKFTIICRAIFLHPSVSVRAAGVQALADLGCEVPGEREMASLLLQVLAERMADPIVAAAARDLLADVED